MNDGTQERTLDPPDEMLSDAELRECERAARDGFDGMDERASKWLDEQLADTPREIAGVVRSALSQTRKPLGVQWHAAALRDYFAAVALQGLLAGGNTFEVCKLTPEGRLVMPGLVGIPPIAYQYADAMLAERAKVTP